ARLARIIQRCQDLPGQELFQYLDASGKRQTVSSDDVNTYLREITSRDVSAKDFRTWGGTMVAAVELRAMGPAASRREADRNIVRALDAVGRGRGPAIPPGESAGRSLGPRPTPGVFVSIPFSFHDLEVASNF